jgi:Na+-driven multidrug efflux pump
MVLNNACKPYEDAAIAAMSIVSRIINFLFSVGLGIGQGYQPVASFNYGAGKYSRVKKGFYFTWLFGTFILGSFAITASFFSRELVGIFRDDPGVIEIGEAAMRYQCISLLFIPFSVCNNMMFQSTGRSLEASILSSFRSGLFFLPIIIVFSRIWGLFGIQISQATADIISGICCIPFTVKYFKTLPADKD